jgi:hypothetical protein
VMQQGSLATRLFADRLCVSSVNQVNPDALKQEQVRPKQGP